MFGRFNRRNNEKILNFTTSDNTVCDSSAQWDLKPQQNIFIQSANKSEYINSAFLEIKIPRKKSSFTVSSSNKNDAIPNVIFQAY